MLSLLLLAALTQAPDCAKPCPCPKPGECSEKACNCGAAAKLKAEIRKAACPTCEAKKTAIVGQCTEYCHCPFPGACGHPGCTCGFALGWLPPSMDRWSTFPAFPGYEFYGKPVNGVFRYSHYQLPGSKTIYAAPGHPPWGVAAGAKARAK